MVDAVVGELALLIHLFIEPDNAGDVFVFEVLNVVLWHEAAVAVVLGALIGGAAEGEELAGHDPVEVPVLHLLVVLIFRDVEGLVLKVYEAHLFGLLRPAQAVQDGEVEGGDAAGGVTEGHERLQMRYRLVSLRGRTVHAQHLVHPNEHRRVGDLVWVSTTAIVYPFSILARLLKHCCGLFAEPICMAEVKRAEVREEGFVDQFAVDAEADRPPGGGTAAQAVRTADRAEVQLIRYYLRRLRQLIDVAHGDWGGM
mmetsp:Transcript_7170/g.13027  ORF Transcript_7170/g.13027 Transcript_7170/m.13027 type:complete len:255 (+) Transcript_7170:1054-1818(+)